MAEDKPPIVSLTRIERISAAHRLHSKQLSDSENRNIFGKCNNANGHGHNYTSSRFICIRFEVTVRGPIDPTTGMVMNLTELGEIIKGCITEKLDHRNIDKDVAYFNEGSIPSTAENLAVFVWQSLKQELQKPELLYKIKIHETDKNSVVYKG